MLVGVTCITYVLHWILPPGNFLSSYKRSPRNLNPSSVTGLLSTMKVCMLEDVASAFGMKKNVMRLKESRLLTTTYEYYHSSDHFSKAQSRNAIVADI